MISDCSSELMASGGMDYHGSCQNVHHNTEYENAGFAVVPTTTNSRRITTDPRWQPRNLVIWPSMHILVASERSVW